MTSLSAAGPPGAGVNRIAYSVLEAQQAIEHDRRAGGYSPPSGTTVVRRYSSGSTAASAAIPATSALARMDIAQRFGRLGITGPDVHGAALGSGSVADVFE